MALDRKMEMIYPIDVDKKVGDSRKVSTNDKVKLYVFIAVVGNLVIAGFLTFFFSSLGVPVWIPLIAQAAIMVMISVFVVRHGVFHETEAIAEEGSELKDNFAKFFQLRDLGDTDKNDYIKMGASVYRYVNGLACFVIELRFGMNDNNRAASIRNTKTELYKMLAHNDFIVREFISREKFSRSKEYRNQIEKIGRNSNVALARTLFEINQLSADIADNDGNVDIIHLMVQTKTVSQTYMLPHIIDGCVRILKNSGYRSVSFLHKDAFIEFMEEFYKLKAIDLSMIKSTVANESASSLDKLVSVYQIIGVDEKGQTKMLTYPPIINDGVKTIKRIL